MSLTSPPTPMGDRNAIARPPKARRRRIAALALLAVTLGVAGPLRSVDAGADPATSTSTTTTTPTAAPVVGPTASSCAPAGFPKPAWGAAPGYIYSPTLFNGVAIDPQPDDTFAADGAGHSAYTGRLQTRTANGREELLVCAHVGTNTFDDALTPFATSAHPATIAPVVSIIDAAGTTTSYGLDTAGLTDVALAHYAGSTDVHEGILQMWVPFTPSLHSPGFTVRTEIRGTAALAGGGPSLVGGADEVYIHLGLAPVARNAPVDQAVGVALDDSVIGERASDPGADDLQSLLKPVLPPMLKDAIAAQAPSNIPSDWEWSPGLALGTSASGTVNSLPFTGGLDSLDVVDFNAKESRLQLHVSGTLYPQLTLKPRAAGFVSILSGSCSVTAQAQVAMDIGVTVGFDSTGTKLETHIAVLQASATTSNVQASGTLLALYTVIPGPMSCGTIEGDISDGISKKVKSAVGSLAANPEVETKIATALNTSAPLGLTDLANGPISSANVTFPAGGGFGIGSAKYVETAPYGHLGGSVWIWHEGIDAAASLAVTDKGGARFPYSIRPASTCSVVTQTHERARPKPPSVLDNVLNWGCGGGLVSTQTQPVAAPTAPPSTQPPLGPVAPVATVPTKGVVNPSPTPAPTSATVPAKGGVTTAAPVRTASQVTGASAASVAAANVMDRTTSAAAAPIVIDAPTATVPPKTATTVPSKPATTLPPKTATTTPATTPVTTAPATTPKTTTPVAPQVLPGKAATTVIAPTTAPAKIGALGIDITKICCLSNPVTLLPTDFDIGVVVNGATVNQLSRALTAGSGDGTGIVDVDTTDEDGNTVWSRPSVAPMYLPSAPANWPAPGAVKLFAPSVRLMNSSNPFMMTADMLLGADAQINTATNHLVPLPSSTVAARIRFLRLRNGNMATEPPSGPIQKTLTELQTDVGPKALKIIEGIAVPDLGALLVNSGLPSMVASNLSLATTGGGHLGIYLNIDPNPARVGVAASWNGVSDTAAPSSFTASLNPTGFPGTGGYTVHWTVSNASGLVTYQSPAAGETSLSKTFNASLASGQSNHQNCDPTRWLGVKVRATVTRNNVTQVGSGSFTSPVWEVPINTHICGGGDIP